MSQSRVSAAAIVGATGVVYGDIGTSPLYAFGAALDASAGSATRSDAVFGILSMIFWALLIVVCIKYLTLVIRADNDGQGGILALLARLERHLHRWGRLSRFMVSAGMLGAAFFFCDAFITPAISVLSAVEGLSVLDARFTPYVLPAAAGILLGLFAIQRRGTGSVSQWFGPIMVGWFLALAVTGIVSIRETPAVLGALDPRWAIWFLGAHADISLVIVGAVFLCLTGAEALYADMGHFGRNTVRAAWFGLVWPALVLNYLGQGALALRTPAALENPLYQLVPAVLLPAAIVLATAATIIASQAVITGAFSMTQQAVQLDFMPRVSIVQTSARERGQIYIPATNWVLLVAVLAVLLAFRSSEALTGAYGAAVAGTELITTLLAAMLARLDWRWPVALIALVFGTFFLLDASFVAGNLLKVPDGAWFPLAMGFLLFVMFEVWRQGRELLRTKLDREAVSQNDLGRYIAGVRRVPGTAIFLASRPDSLPTAFIRNLEHNHVLHENVVFLHIEFRRVPKIDPEGRVTIDTLTGGIYSVRANYGFMESPEVRDIVQECGRRGLRFFNRDYTFFLGQHIVVPLEQRRVHLWQRQLFATLQRRATGAAEFFGMPLRRVVILSTVVEI